MDAQERIEEARRRFGRSLVGLWSTAVGTFNMVMDQHWEIRPDGTGKFTDTGPFGYPRSETHFEWRQPAEGVFELRLIRYVALQPDYEAELDEDELQWQTIRYDFVVVGTEFGSEMGMVDLAQAGSEHDETFLLERSNAVGQTRKTYIEQRCIDLIKVERKTLKRLGKKAHVFIDVANDWLDINRAILDTYPGRQAWSFLLITFWGLFKEVTWLQFFFAAGNYPLVLSRLRFT